MADVAHQLLRYWHVGVKSHRYQWLAEQLSKHGVLTPRSNILSGTLESEFVAALPPVRDGAQDTLRKGLIAPIRLKSRLEHRLNWQGAPRLIYPLWIPVTVGEDGQLKIQSGLDPWVSRSVLEPAPGPSVTLSHWDLWDDFFFQNAPVSENATWEQVIEFCARLVSSVFKKTLDEFHFEEYTLDENGLFLPDRDLSNLAIFECQSVCQKKEARLHCAHDLKIKNVRPSQTGLL